MPKMTSLKVSTAFRAFVLDQLEELGPVTSRSMFGGVGLYCRDLFFGIIARDVLYLKVDDVTRGAYVRAGMEPFRPYPTRPASMQYYAVPVDVLESAGDLVTWAQKAVGAASRGVRRGRPLGRT
jgi:DNA transformation protein and related proteins